MRSSFTLGFLAIAVGAGFTAAQECNAEKYCAFSYNNNNCAITTWACDCEVPLCKLPQVHFMSFLCSNSTRQSTSALVHRSAAARIASTIFAATPKTSPTAHRIALRRTSSLPADTRAPLVLEALPLGFLPTLRSLMR